MSLFFILLSPHAHAGARLIGSLVAMSRTVRACRRHRDPLFHKRFNELAYLLFRTKNAEVPLQQDIRVQGHEFGQ